MNRRFLPLCLALVLSSCVYEFPITAEPTRKIDERLVGTWLAGKPKDNLEVRKFDDAHYVVFCDGNFYRAYHSDVAGKPLVNIQTLEDKERKYWFVSYELTDGGKKLIVHSVNKEIVPDTVKSSAEIQKLITEHLKNPKLFTPEDQEKETTYRRADD